MFILLFFNVLLSCMETYDILHTFKVWCVWSILPYFSAVPHIIRTDRGTENTLIEDIQIAFRYQDNDDHSDFKSFMYGKSTSNQVNVKSNSFQWNNKLLLIFFDTSSSSILYIPPVEYSRTWRCRIKVHRAVVAFI